MSTSEETCLEMKQAGRKVTKAGLTSQNPSKERDRNQAAEQTQKSPDMPLHL
jgi:hypothetical protein